MGASAAGARAVKILYQRIDQLSNSRNEKTASLLGHVIAHEMGHLFLPPSPHVLIGLMQENLDLRLAAKASLWFTPGQGLAIRKNVIERLLN